MRVTVVVGLVLSAASLCSADEASFASGLSKRLGRPVEATRAVTGEVPRDGLTANVENPLAPDPAPPQQDLTRAYRGQLVELKGVTVQRLTFRDPAAAREFAERHVDPPAVAEVRGKHVVAITGPDALAAGVADAVLAEAWTGAPARAPRDLLAIAEGPGELAWLTAPQGELWQQVENTLRKAEGKYPGAPVGVPQRVSDTLQVTWTDAGHRALLAEGSVHASCDARGPLARAVIAKDAAGHARLGRRLDELAGTQTGARGPAPQAAASPASVGLNKVVELVEESLETGEITAPIR